MQCEEVEDSNNDLDVIEISATDDESQENIERKLQEHLKGHNW